MQESKSMYNISIKEQQRGQITKLKRDKQREGDRKKEIKRECDKQEGLTLKRQTNKHTHTQRERERERETKKGIYELTYKFKKSRIL